MMSLDLLESGDGRKQINKEASYHKDGPVVYHIITASSYLEEKLTTALVLRVTLA
jgi:hypothetical protein